MANMRYISLPFAGTCNYFWRCLPLCCWCFYQEVGRGQECGSYLLRSARSSHHWLNHCKLPSILSSLRFWCFHQVVIEIMFSLWNMVYVNLYRTTLKCPLTWNIIIASISFRLFVFCNFFSYLDSDWVVGVYVYVCSKVLAINTQTGTELFKIKSAELPV